ncbi:MAG: 30S ribosomal protein S4 [Fibromonadaceae bacterium]|jgi:small subunit ribosomal protein S4|nr:30S ribosomal protein S4 [Fibromonadaceae bacterium]
MAYRGPKAKVARSLDLAVTPKTQKVLERRKFPPGQHGMGRKRSAGVYKQQLVEKQRLKFTYNISESQLARTYHEANRRDGSSGDNLMILLETRLDSLVYRSGFARTIFAARQYVAHGHFMVNGRRSYSPNHIVKANDLISVREKSKNHPQVKEAIEGAPEAPVYLAVSKDKFEAKLVNIPLRDQIPVKLNEQLVVEFYSK